MRACVKPADRIACCSWPLENHSAGRATSWEFLPDADYYGIPYGCLVVKGFDNLLVAGRNLSATHIAHASARVAGPCFAVGEAAGMAAAMSVQSGGPIRALEAERRTDTRARGAESAGKIGGGRSSPRSRARLIDLDELSACVFAYPLLFAAWPALNRRRVGYRPPALCPCRPSSTQMGPCCATRR